MKFNLYNYCIIDKFIYLRNPQLKNQYWIIVVLIKNIK